MYKRKTLFYSVSQCKLGVAHLATGNSSVCLAITHNAGQDLYSTWKKMIRRNGMPIPLFFYNYYD